MFLDNGIKSECSGCTACASGCPHDAIEMRPDALGFLYPIRAKRKMQRLRALQESVRVQRKL